MKKNKRKKNKFFIYFLLSIALIFFTAENYLIVCEYPLFSVNNARINQNDRYMPLLGWTNKPNMKKTADGEEPVPNQENVDSLGRRYIGKDVENPEKRLLFLGCSYTFGLEISDEETYICKTSKHFPKWQFDNYASPGYGTHQCRIMLEKLLTSPNCPKYDYVFYSFIEDHPRRIAYDFAFIPDKNNNNILVMPYADFAWNGKIKYQSYNKPFIPGAEILRTSSFINNLYASRKSASGKKHDKKNALYNAVLQDMLDLCKKNNIDFSVLILENSNYHIDKDLLKSGLNVYDIILPDLENPKYHVNNNIYNHPNDLANDYWAEKLTAILMEKAKDNNRSSGLTK